MVKIIGLFLNPPSGEQTERIPPLIVFFNQPVRSPDGLKQQSSKLQTRTLTNLYIKTNTPLVLSLSVHPPFLSSSRPLWSGGDEEAYINWVECRHRKAVSGQVWLILPLNQVNFIHEARAARAPAVLRASVYVTVVKKIPAEDTPGASSLAAPRARLPFSSLSETHF